MGSLSLVERRRWAESTEGRASWRRPTAPEGPGSSGPGRARAASSLCCRCGRPPRRPGCRPRRWGTGCGPAPGRSPSGARDGSRRGRRCRGAGRHQRHTACGTRRSDPARVPGRTLRLAARGRLHLPPVRALGGAAIAPGPPAGPVTFGVTALLYRAWRTMLHLAATCCRTRTDLASMCASIRHSSRFPTRGPAVVVLARPARRRAMAAAYLVRAEGP